MITLSVSDLKLPIRYILQSGLSFIAFFLWCSDACATPKHSKLWDSYDPAMAATIPPWGGLATAQNTTLNLYTLGSGLLITTFRICEESGGVRQGNSMTFKDEKTLVVACDKDIEEVYLPQATFRKVIPSAPEEAWIGGDVIVVRRGAKIENYSLRDFSLTESIDAPDVESILLSPNGKLLLLNRPNAIDLHNLNTQTTSQLLLKGADSDAPLAFTPDSSGVFVRNQKGGTLYDLEGHPKTQYKSKEPISKAAFINNDELLTLAGNEGVLHHTDQKKGEPIPLEYNASLLSAADGSFFCAFHRQVSCFSSQSLTTQMPPSWLVSPLEATSHRLYTHDWSSSEPKEDNVQSLIVTKNGDAITASNTKLRLYEQETGEIKQRFKICESSLADRIYLKDEQTLLIVCDDHLEESGLWEKETKKVLRFSQQPLRVLFGGELLAVVAASDQIDLYSLSEYSLLWSFRTPATIRSLAFSPDGRWLATGLDGSDFVMLYNCVSGAETKLRDALLEQIQPLSLSDDGRLLTYSKGNTLSIYDAQSQVPLLQDKLPNGSCEGDLSGERTLLLCSGTLSSYSKKTRLEGIDFGLSDVLRFAVEDGDSGLYALSKSGVVTHYSIRSNLKPHSAEKRATLLSEDFRLRLGLGLGMVSAVSLSVLSYRNVQETLVTAKDRRNFAFDTISGGFALVGFGIKAPGSLPLLSSYFIGMGLTSILVGPSMAINFKKEDRFGNAAKIALETTLIVGVPTTLGALVLKRDAVPPTHFLCPKRLFFDLCPKLPHPFVETRGKLRKALLFSVVVAGSAALTTAGVIAVNAALD